MAEAVRLEHRRRGYPSAKVTARVDVFHQPDRATLVLDVTPGPRARILEVRTTQVDAAERSTITELPNISAGQIYDEVEIGRELQGGRTAYGVEAITKLAPFRTPASRPTDRCFSS